MGRGRAKAKQTKVARALKYTTTGTDLDRLRAELSTGDSLVDSSRPAELDEESEDLDLNRDEDGVPSSRRPTD